MAVVGVEGIQNPSGFIATMWLAFNSDSLLSKQEFQLSGGEHHDNSQSWATLQVVSSLSPSKTALRLRTARVLATPHPLLAGGVSLALRQGHVAIMSSFRALSHTRNWVVPGIDVLQWATRNSCQTLVRYSWPNLKYLNL